MSRLDDVATIWWLGSWRAGDKVYWWTTAVAAETWPDGDGRDAVRAAVQARIRATTWAQTVDPGTRRNPRAPGPVDAAFVAAGAIGWDQLEPHLVALASAVPVQADPAVQAEAVDLARRWRRVRKIATLAPGVSAVSDDERAALLAEQIELGLRSAALNRTAVAASLERAWTGPLVDPASNTSLFRALGSLLVPDVLREYLTHSEPASRATTTVVLAPAPELGQVPWDLLVLDDESDTRLVEHALLRGGMSPATVVDLALPAAPDRPDLPGLLVIDPAVAPDRHDPVPIYPDGLPDAWTTPNRCDVIAGEPPNATTRDDTTASTRNGAGCSRRQLSDLLRAQQWGRFVFHGHVSAGDALSPTAAALVLSPDNPETPTTTRDGRALEEPGGTSRLSARVWLHDPQRWPMPRRVAFIACQADDASYVEQTGLTLAAINAGARIVTTTRWSLPTDATAALDKPQIGPTTALAIAVDNALGEPDPAAALRTWQLTELEAWRNAATPGQQRAHAPLLWASLITYVLPDTIAVEPLDPHKPP